MLIRLVSNFLGLTTWLIFLLSENFIKIGLAALKSIEHIDTFKEKDLEIFYKSLFRTKLIRNFINSEIFYSGK